MGSCCRPLWAALLKHRSCAAAQAPAVNLFDRLISNDDGVEAEALAHETPVLLPPRSAFLMSDITRLKPLLPGVQSHAMKPLLVESWCFANLAACKFAGTPDQNNR